MRLLHQYILKQFSLYLVLSVIFFTGVLVAGNATKSMMNFLVEGKLSLGNCIFLMTMLLPSMVSYALPFGFVTATLLTVGKMSVDREFVALKNFGVSPLKVFSPILFFASCGVLGSLVINFHFAPRAISKVKNKIQNIIREEPLRFVAPQKFVHNFPGYIIFVKNLNHNRLGNFHIWEFDEHEKLVSHVRAKQGMLEYDEKKQALIVTLLQGTAEKMLREKRNSPLVFFEKFSLDLPLENIFKEIQAQKKIRHMTISEMLAFRDQSILKGDFQKKTEVQVHIQMHCAMAFAILALVLMTLPLSIKLHQKKVSLNVAFALLICIVYYFFIIIPSFLSKKPYLHPELLVWLPNVVLQIWGIIQLMRINRH